MNLENNKIELKASKSIFFGKLLDRHTKSDNNGLWCLIYEIREYRNVKYIVLPQIESGRLWHTQFRVVSGKVPRAKEIANKYNWEKPGLLSNYQWNIDHAWEVAKRAKEYDFFK